MNDPQDVVSLLIALIAILASKEIAYLVGPYAAIVVLACSGAALALSGHESDLTYGQALIYVGVRVLTAVVLTVTLAEFVQIIAPWAKPRYTLVPLAFGIGWIKDYTSIRQWIGEIIRKIAARKTDG